MVDSAWEYQEVSITVLKDEYVATSLAGHNREIIPAEGTVTSKDPETRMWTSFSALVGSLNFILSEVRSHFEQRSDMGLFILHQSLWF